MKSVLEKEIARLQRELNLYKQTFEQNKNISQKYTQTLDELKAIKETLELKVAQRTKTLEEKEHFLQSIVNGIEDPLLVINTDYTINMMNSTLEKSIDKEHISDIDKPKCYEVLHYRSLPCDEGENPLPIECPLKKIVQTKNVQKTLYLQVLHVNSNRNIEALSAPLFNDKNEFDGIVQVHRDITEHLQIRDDLERQKDKFDHQAHYDILTDLPNRLYFNEKISHAIKKAQRRKTKIALFFIDLDRFKQVNDTLGHNYGDKVLIESAKKIQNILRSDDTLFRLGGDEFTIIMENIYNEAEPSKLAKRIVAAMEKPLMIDGHSIYISSSIGISLYPNDSLFTTDLIKYSDAAMYKAKADGRNNFKFYSSELTEKVTYEFELERRLRAAIANNEFVIYYQPQFNTQTNTTTGFEALVRWLSPDYGIIVPDQFIPLAEETGLIIQIDTIVMQKAMQHFSELYKQGINPGILSLNVSVKQLESSNFIENLQNNMKTYAFKPEWLELEITESDIMNKPEENVKKLNTIHDMGIQIAIDDFGTGYSSLSYLKKMPISKIKIDQSFVKELPYDTEDAQITKAVIALSQSLNLKTITEGVETQEQKDFLTQNNCLNIQGYLQAKPMNEQDMRTYLSQSLQINKNFR